ncbi:MAG: trypsin-like serine protease, partial [Planctomycetota bacterium]|nr:trypsin-like serine protease [Planctomycetota bacterium]
GHCVDLDPDQNGPGLPDGVLDVPGPVEFNVPASLANGTTVAAAPDDQYPVDTTSFSWRFDGSGQGLGKDWSVFAVFENSNTGLMPHEVYGFPYRITREAPSAGNTIRITGFGVDNTPVGSTGNRNAQNQTNQTHTGGYLSENTGGSSADISHEYQVDTMGGNSGSPILWNSQNLAIGIHTNAGCSSTNGNTGTSFEVNALESAINAFPGWGTEHVDVGHPLPVSESGSVYRPWDTVAEGVSAASAGGVISLVTGTYTEGAQVISKQLDLAAPIGTVVIR